MGASFEVGLTALRASQKAMITLGQNIANANTQGYSRQIPILSAERPTQGAFGLEGQGVRLDRIERASAENLNSRLLEKQSALSQALTLGERLTDLEGVFNEPSDFGIKNAISSFFDSVQEVSKNPENAAARVQMIERAKAMAGRFNVMSSDIDSMLANVRSDAENIVRETNILSIQIGDLNEKISSLSVGGFIAHDLEDQRDEALLALSKLIKIDVQLSTDGATKNVKFSGRELVAGGVAVPLTTNIGPDGNVSVLFKRDLFPATSGGGELGGVFEFQTFANTSKGRLDVLASSMIDQVNRVHSEGVKLSGSFSIVTGSNKVNDPASPLNNVGLDFVPTDGKLYVTVRDVTGPVVKTEVDINATDSLNDVVNKLNANPGLVNLTASVSANTLKIEADSGFSFDFSRSVDPNPPSLGGSVVEMDGQFTGIKNDVYTLTVVGGTGGADTIGVTNGLKLRVTDSGGTFSRDFNIGVNPAAPPSNNTYNPGNTIDIGDGLKLALSAGTVTNGDSFSVKVLNDSDESNILAALGINTFFSGSTAQSMGVVSDIEENESLIAAGSSSSIGDNSNAIRLLGLDSQLIVAGSTFGDHITETVTRVGLELESTDRNVDAEDGVFNALATLKLETVGVSIDEELARLLGLEQLFNASARFVTTLDAALNRLLEI